MLWEYICSGCVPSCLEVIKENGWGILAPSMYNMVAPLMGQRVDVRPMAGLTSIVKCLSYMGEVGGYWDVHASGYMHGDTW